jgi:glucose/arabinose dehydrogenase
MNSLKVILRNSAVMLAAGTMFKTRVCSTRPAAWPVRALLLSSIGMLLLISPPATPAATVWTGPTIAFSKAAGADHTMEANQDRITPNVWITRGSTQGIYNINTETLYTHNSSPADTRWAYGTTANYASLTYQTWEDWHGGQPSGPPSTVGQDAVLHLVSEDIYIDIKFTSWGVGDGAFSYERSTPAAANSPPSVTITNPPASTSLPLPANFTIGAEASDPDGSVASVQFFDGATSLGTDTTPPYSVTVDLYPGVHPLTAVATDNLGLMATSAVVSVTVTSTPIANPIADPIPKGDITVELKTIADGMISPLGMAVPDDGSGRMFVYDQAGLVWLVTAAGRSPAPVLDLRTRLVNISGNYDERGFLGLALHTNFATYPYLYTYTSEFSSGPADFPSTLQLGGTNNHQSVIAEWQLNPSTTNVVNPATRREILRIDQPQSNHNGGAMRFGPDGLLYVALGDGGAADDQGNGHTDPGGNGQNSNNIWGTVIRIDVNGNNSANGQYGIPASNPFVGGPGVDEIFAYGLRNPFSFHFDRTTGDLWLGDVGQNKIEEINIITVGGNYGWNVKEGTFYFDPNGAAAGYVTAFPTRPVPPGLIDPVAEYDHDDGTAVIGGTVYRGSALPALVGRYVFGDWGVFGSPSGRLYYLDAGMNVKELRLGLEDRPLGLYLKGFGEDAAGELYIFASRPQGPTGAGGVMLKLVPPPAAALAVSGSSIVGTNFQTTLTGGIGPFAQQRKLSLDEAVWLNDAFTAGNTLTTPVRGSSGFFREVDTVRQMAMPLTTVLRGSGSGSGSGILSLAGNTLRFSLNYRDLTGTATQAHIHGPAGTGGSAGILVDLEPFNGGAFGSSGTLAGTVVLTDEQKAHLLAGRTYVNVHTVANPGGEIRGQLAPVLMTASVLGGYESPAVNTPASGLGTFMLVGTQLTYTVSFRGLSGPATGAHIHGPADIGQNAGVLIPFSVPAATAGTVSGTASLTPAQLAAIVDGRTYVNFHTAANVGGEIRGQILAQSTAVPFTAWVSGLNERLTPLTNSAAGLGLFSLEGDQLAFNITYSGLSGTATAAHIHGPAAASANAGVQIDLAPYHIGEFGASGAFSGVVTLTPTQRSMMLNGQAYFNIHTVANPGGEARGQIAAVLMSAAADGPAERPTAIISTGNALGLFALVANQLDLNITYRTLSGTVSDAHIHGPATTSASAGVLVGLSGFNNGAFGASGTMAGGTVLSAPNLASLIDGLTYINLHTAANPSGEIRGQVVR